MPASETSRPLTASERAKNDADQKKHEKTHADTLSTEKFTGFRAPKGSESAEETFTPPKQNPDEGIAAYSARVKKAREEFAKTKGQKKAIKG